MGSLLPPKDGIATLAIYRDGSVRLGAWGRGITSTLDLVAFRQNCPLLLDAGQINPSVNDGSRKEWGYTVENLDTTWRSGVGISRDGRFLIYVAGNLLTVESLGRTLQEGGPMTPCNWTLTAFTPALSPTRLLMRPIRNIQSIRHGGSARERCCVHVGQRAR